MRFVTALMLVLLTPRALSAQEGLAPSCQSVLASFGVKPEPSTLLAVVEGALVAANDAKLKRGREYDFYYVFQSRECKQHPCVNPIIAIKTLKITKARSPAEVILFRESVSGTAVRKEEYDKFHQDLAIIPYGAFNNFHVSYNGPSRERLHTHLPMGRRESYLFSDIPTGKSPWLAARNYRFTLNGDLLPQCIRFQVTLQQSTESLYVEVGEIENGRGTQPPAIERWTPQIN